MPERVFDDDRHYVRHDEQRSNNASSWLVPLLLLPVAFLGGWVANGYVNDGSTNQLIPGIETGVGGGPDDRGNLISPLPTSGVDNISPTTTPTPTIKIVTPSPSAGL